MNTLPEKKDDLLKKLITSDFQEDVPANFANDVMSRLNISNAKAPVKIEPIIPLRGWLLVAAVVATFIYVSLSAEGTSNSNDSIVGMQIQNFFEALINSLNNSLVSQYISIASLAVLGIVIVESFYRKTRITAS